MTTERQTFVMSREQEGSRPPSSVLLPTACGVFWALAAAAALLTAINYGNNIAFALAFLLFSIWLSAAWDCLRNLRGLDWLPVKEATAFAGKPLHLSGTLIAPDTRQRDPVYLKAASPGISGTPGTSGNKLEISLTAPARGRHRIAGLSLVSRHPASLWQARRALPPVDVLIYPHPAEPVSALPLPKESPHPAHLRQEADDFQELRPYTPGDTPNRINWRMFARRDELAVNVFNGDTGGQTLWLDIAACEGNTEERLSRLCQWVLEASRQGREYGLSLRDGAVPGQGGHYQKMCLARLALHTERSY